MCQDTRFGPTVDMVLSTSFSDKILLRSINTVIVIYLITLNITQRLFVTFQAAWACGPLGDRGTLVYINCVGFKSDSDVKKKEHLSSSGRVQLLLSWTSGSDRKKRHKPSVKN